MITYQEESWTQIEEELKELFPVHWEEIALDKDIIKLKPNYTLYKTLDGAGNLQTITVRDEGKLIGYHVCLIHSHMHYEDSLTAFTDIFFIEKKYRKGRTGLKLFQFMEQQLKSKNVQKIYMGTKLSLDISSLLEYLNYRPIEKLYSKLL